MILHMLFAVSVVEMFHVCLGVVQTVVDLSILCSSLWVELQTLS